MRLFSALLFLLISSNLSTNRCCSPGCVSWMVCLPPVVLSPCHLFNDAPTTLSPELLLMLHSTSGPLGGWPACVFNVPLLLLPLSITWGCWPNHIRQTAHYATVFILCVLPSTHRSPITTHITVGLEKPIGRRRRWTRGVRCINSTQPDYYPLRQSCDSACFWLGD